MVRDSKTSTQAQPETGSAKIARVIFPPVEGGLLSRTSNLLTTQERKKL